MQSNGQSYSEWQVKRLRNLAKRITARNIDSKVIRVLTNSALGGVVDQRDYFERDIVDKNNLHNYFVVLLGDYVYNPRISANAPVGPISKNKIGTGVMSPLYTIFRFKYDRNDFYEYYFKSSRWHEYMRRISNTGARHDRMSILIDDFMNMPLPVPDKEEQQKIADCLSSIDELIAAQTHKLGALKAHKKGLMQQLFPAEGETVPRLRFSEFGGIWQEVSLGSLCYGISSGKNKVDNSGNYDLYGSTGIIGKTSSATYDGDYILVARVGANAGLLARANGKFGVTDNTLVIHLREAANIDFMFYALESMDLNRMVFGSGQPLITGTQLKCHHLRTPPAASEQHKVAKLLGNIDDLIFTQTEKIESLKAQKKGLMQQLFPDC